MSRRFVLLSAVVIATLLPVTALFSQENLPNTLQQLLDALKGMQNEVKALRSTVQRLMKDAKNNKGTETTAAVPETAAVAIQANWRNALETYKRGKQLEEQRQYRPAIEAYSRAIQFDPKSDTAFLHRGNCLFQLGENAAAVSDYTQSLALQPNSSRAYLARALALASSGQNENALADSSEALRRDPQFLDAYLLRGRLYQQQGNRELASADFNKAVSVAPQSEKAYLGRADVLESNGQPEQALNDCQNAVRINPNSAAGYLCRAESYLKMKLADRAMEDVNHAVVTAQTFNQPLPLGGALAQALQEPAVPVSGGAISPVTTPFAPQPGMAPTPAALPVPPPATASKPPAMAGQASHPAPTAVQQADAQNYVREGREFVQKGQFNEALILLGRAIETDPWLAAAYNLRGYAYLRLLQYDQAAADCSEAIRLQPTFLNAYENRASARRHLGDRAGAQEDARKVADLLAGPQKPVAANSSLSAKR